jgi:purine-binding chemotaxis protein CheW
MAGEMRQLVSFYLGKEKYGVDIDFVQEIIRMPVLTKAPLTPPHIEGLANLRGTILAVVNGRVRFGIERREFDEANRVIVLDYQGRKLGFIVDRVSDVVTVSEDNIEEKETGRGEFVEGVAKVNEGGSLVLIVNVEKLFPKVEEKAAAAATRWSFAAEEREKTKEQEEESQLVSFRVGKEEFALDIADVQEIVHLPGEISQVPGAPYYCEGLASLRGKLLPIVRLGSILGTGEEEFDERARVVVVNIARGGKRLTAGLAVDGVSEVLRVPKKVIEPVPALLRTREAEFLAGVCNLDSRRLVHVLDAGKLFSDADYEALLYERGDEEEDKGILDLRDEEEQYVTFQLDAQEYGAPISQVQEIIRVPQIFAVPRAPEFVDGVISIRGEIVPVVDLRKRFGLEERSLGETNRIIVVDLGDTRTGLVVDAVREVLGLSRRDIEEVPEVFTESGEADFLKGIGKARQGERILILLDLLRLLSREERDELKHFSSEVEQEVAEEVCEPGSLGGEAIEETGKRSGQEQFADEEDQGSGC